MSITSPGARERLRATWADISILPEAWNDMSCLREFGNILFIIGKIRFNDWSVHFKLWERIGLDVAAVALPGSPERGHVLFRGQSRPPEP